MIVQLVAGLVATVCIHEAGHVAAAILLRLPWRPTVTRHGPGVRIGRADLDLSRWQVRITAAGGPVANILLAAVCIELHLGLIALLSLVFAATNLIPLPRSDGSRILRAAHELDRARSAS
jgi:Zn-dependent protease